ncbi:hypothetical protein [Pseudomonas indica]|uniref:hypothetical protein n=1 Tax=Pseudomonas indica TaxID=137658 RepID=UPI0023F8CAEC|nr:hypothetical protein [Pseudomonas indica]MBU3057514.1 harpin HrpZ family protein [Pseudomonas indica]
MSIFDSLKSAAATTINITLEVTPQGRGLGLANELLGGGGQDLASSLTDTLMKGLFGDADSKGISKFNDWDKGSKSTDNPLLDLLAEFMDASNGDYGKPHGKAGNWKEELSENDTVNQQERDAFGQGLKDVLSMFLDQSINEAIMGLALGNMFGGGMGSNPFGGNGSDPFGGNGSNPFSNNPFSGSGSGSNPFSSNPFSNGLSGLGGLFGNGLSGMGQTGMGFGLDFASHTGLQKLNDIGTHKDGDNRHFVNKEDRGTAEEIGKFMDQHPEIFGKPEYQKDGGSVKTDSKSWAEALSKPDDDGMTGDSMNKFHEAKNILKDVMLGDTSRCPSKATAGDAMLAISNIVSEGLSKTSNS